MPADPGTKHITDSGCTAARTRGMSPEAIGLAVLHLMDLLEMSNGSEGAANDRDGTGKEEEEEKEKKKRDDHHHVPRTNPIDPVTSWSDPLIERYGSLPFPQKVAPGCPLDPKGDLGEEPG
jgi:hypothetical protein